MNFGNAHDVVGVKYCCLFVSPKYFVVSYCVSSEGLFFSFLAALSVFSESVFPLWLWNMSLLRTLLCWLFIREENSQTKVEVKIPE